tara:strand:- start:219 stop:662 length:444 start_codon:yes stop_codon:yes gene_type:complete
MSYVLELSKQNHWINQLNQTITFGDVIFFNGPLGVGKTTLIAKLAQLRNIHTQPTSPTFSKMNIYSIDHHRHLLHIDAYNFKHQGEIDNLGLDMFEPQTTIMFIEWSEKLPDDYFTPKYSINMSFSGDVSSRIVKILDHHGSEIAFD